jgi:hypothetical protein
MCYSPLSLVCLGPGFAALSSARATLPPLYGTPWPAGVSQPILGWIGTIECPIINPPVQIEIKQKFPEWRPDLPVHEKHQLDIKRLREGLYLSSPSGKDG